MNKTKKIVKIQQNCKIIGFIITLFGVLVSSVNAASLKINIDTNSLTGSQGLLIFDFIDGDGVANNSVTIKDFITDGTLRSESKFGGITGTLPDEVIIEDTEFFNELIQPITLGSAIDLGVTFTENFAGGILADSFTVLLIDELNFSSLYSTTDPTGNNALLAFELTENGIEYETYRSIVNVSAIPEPNTLIIIVLGLILLVLKKNWHVLVGQNQSRHLNDSIRIFALNPCHQIKAENLQIFFPILTLLLLNIAYLSSVNAGQQISVKSSVDVRYSGLRYNRVAKTFDTVASITNTSSQPIFGPLSLVTKDINPLSVALSNANKNTAIGTLIEVPVSRGVLLPNKTVTTVLRFSNPESIRFTFDNDVLGAQVEISEPNALPIALGVDTQTEVSLAVKLSSSIDLPDEITMKQIGPSGQEIKQYALNDLGENGDTYASDGTYGNIINIDTLNISAQKCLLFQANLEINSINITSPLKKLCVTGFPTDIVIPSDLSDDNIIDLAPVVGSEVPIQVLADTVIMEFVDNTSEEQIATIVDRVNGIINATIIPLGQYQIRLATRLSAREMDALIKDLENLSAIKKVFPDLLLFAAAEDPGYILDNNEKKSTSGQEGLKKIQANQAWKFSKGEGINIAVLDSGVITTHEDLENIASNSEKDISNKNHGTRVTGIIGATHDNGKGIKGITSGANIQVFKTLTQNNEFLLSGTTFETSLELINASSINPQPHIMNLSFGTALSSSYLDPRICLAVEAATEKEIIVVAASGNIDSNKCKTKAGDINPVYPAACNMNNSRLISVANSTLEDKNNTDKKEGSCFGSWVDVFAPGTGILSTINNSEKYGRETGTSFSAPIVTGAAAILLKRYPRESDKLKGWLQTYGKKIGNIDQTLQGKIKRVDVYETIIGLNKQPIPNNKIPNQEVIAFNDFNFQFSNETFNDAEGDKLTYTATLTGGNKLPQWLTFDSPSRTFSGTPTSENIGTITIEVVANDGLVPSKPLLFSVSVTGERVDFPCCSITDTFGDLFTRHESTNLCCDFKSMAAVIQENTLKISARFGAEFDPKKHALLIGLDTDKNAFTGILMKGNTEVHQLGVDIMIVIARLTGKNPKKTIQKRVTNIANLSFRETAKPNVILKNNGYDISIPFNLIEADGPIKIRGISHNLTHVDGSIFPADPDFLFDTFDYDVGHDDFTYQDEFDYIPDLNLPPVILIPPNM